jgi:pSer/pThr/pTyr-binding forkhead associated (FHA) protein
VYNILSWTVRYLFIALIYYFIFNIIRLIYLDIYSIKNRQKAAFNSPYLKLINRKEQLDFPIQEFYDLQDVITIGRGKKNDIQIPDKFVSSHHAKITMDEEEYFMEDLESVNGSFVNGVQIQDAVKLKNGDRIGIGEIEFLFVKEVE